MKSTSDSAFWEVLEKRDFFSATFPKDMDGPPPTVVIVIDSPAVEGTIIPGESVTLNKDDPGNHYGEDGKKTTKK